MSRRSLGSVFGHEKDILGATKAAREHGYKIEDVYTPYAVHGMDAAQGLKKSKLPYVCLGLGLAGAAAKLWYQLWTSATSWPVNVGGKPLKSVPAFVPVTFEIMVLFAGVGTVIALLLVSRLWFGKKPKVLYDRVTDDRFVLVLEETDATFDVNDVRRIFHRYNLISMEERVEGSVRLVSQKEKVEWAEVD
jgi:hypothetical protein